MVSRISCGNNLSSLFTMPSGPGDLSLLRVFMHSVKAVSSRILGWSHLLCLNPWDSSFVIRDWRVKGSGIGEICDDLYSWIFLGASSGRSLPLFMLTAFIVSEKYFSTIWACLVGLVSMVLVSGSRRARSPVRGCVLLSLKISLCASLGLVLISFCSFLRERVLLTYCVFHPYS